MTERPQSPLWVGFMLGLSGTAVDFLGAHGDVSPPVTLGMAVLGTWLGWALYGRGRTRPSCKGGQGSRPGAGKSRDAAGPRYGSQARPSVADISPLGTVPHS